MSSTHIPSTSSRITKKLKDEAISKAFIYVVEQTDTDETRYIITEEGIKQRNI